MISTSLRHRCNLTLISNLCEAALISLFWDPNVVNELLEEHFEIPFISIRQIYKGSFNWPIMARIISHPGIQVRTQNMDFGAVLQMDLNRV